MRFGKDFKRELRIIERKSSTRRPLKPRAETPSPAAIQYQATVAILELGPIGFDGARDGLAKNAFLQAELQREGVVTTGVLVPTEDGRRMFLAIHDMTDQERQLVSWGLRNPKEAARLCRLT